jgi:hypothetical protein
VARAAGRSVVLYKVNETSEESTASVFRDISFYTLKMEAVCYSETPDSS